VWVDRANHGSSSTVEELNWAGRPCAAQANQLGFRIVVEAEPVLGARHPSTALARTCTAGIKVGEHHQSLGGKDLVT
jgi:hypothetical protein